MKASRFFISLILLLFSLCIATACDDSDYITDARHYDYELNADGDAVIIGNSIPGGHFAPAYEAEIPSEIDGYKVVAIGSEALRDAWIDKIVVPDTVRSIGDFAFADCLWLREVELPSSVAEVGKNPFRGLDELSITVTGDNPALEIRGNMLCNKETGTLVHWINDENIKRLDIPDDISVVGAYAFYDSTLSYINIPDSVTDVLDGAFEECSISVLSIGKNLSNIGDLAFRYCRKLSEIALDDGNMHFLTLDDALYTADMSSLIIYYGSDTEFSVPYGVAEISPGAFYERKTLVKIELSPSVKAVGAYAFECCSSLRELVIADGVEALGEELIDGCHAMVEINLPASINSVSETTFDYAEALSAINVDEENTAYKSIDGILYTKDGKCLVRSPMGKGGKIAVADGTQIIASRAFRYSSGEEIILPDGLVEIGPNAFSDTHFSEIIVPDSVETIGKGAFSLGSVDLIRIGSGVRYIGENAFVFLTVHDEIEFAEIDGWAYYEDGEMVKKIHPLVFKLKFLTRRFIVYYNNYGYHGYSMERRASS